MRRNNKGKQSSYIPLWLVVVTMVLLFCRVSLRAYQNNHPQAVKGAIHWLEPVKLKSEKSDDKLFLLDFTAQWCAPCSKMNEITLMDRSVIEAINKDFIPIRVLDRRMEEGENPREIDLLQDKYYVNSFPDFVATLADGTKVEYHTGYAQPKEFIEFLDGALRRAWIKRAMKEMYNFDYQLAKSYLFKYSKKPDWQKSGVDTLVIYWHILKSCNDSTVDSIVSDALAHYRKTISKRFKRIKKAKRNLDEIWPLPLIRYFNGELSNQELIKACDERKGKESDAYLCIGLNYLQKKNKDEAIKNFKEVIERDLKYFGSYEVAHEYLLRLIDSKEEKD